MREVDSSRQRPRCPFYGFHWPSRGTDLIEMGSSECGLDLDRNQPCQMELEQLPVDFESCAMRSQTKNLLEAGKRYIRFHGTELPSGGVPLETWQRVVMKRD